MSQKKSLGYGFRGWMLILYQAIAYVCFQCFTQYPLNILSDFYGGAQLVSKIYSICAIVGILVQVVLVGLIAKMKNIKRFGAVLGIVSLAFGFVIMTATPGPVWYGASAVMTIVAGLSSTLAIGLLIGQWFPTRKGTVMGIATLAFPIANGLLGPFATSVFAPVGMAQAMGQQPVIFGVGGAVFNAFLPFFIVCVVGWRCIP